ncbi:hypothetical protein EDC02_7699 [Micromonospora sp. Llam0]|nr:hypothetical protein EDC02_7699 [Micromonospora sp. Llam0]
MTTSDQDSGIQPSLPSSASRRHAMGGRAAVTITEQTGATRAFVALGASPRYLIPLAASTPRHR